MTDVYLEQNGKRYLVSAKGHATGSIETCAAISTLMYSLAGWLHNSNAVTYTERLEPGDSCLSYSDSDDTIFKFITIAFLQLEKSNTEHLDVYLHTIT